jgi:hypothetical protein
MKNGTEQARRFDKYRSGDTIYMKIRSAMALGMARLPVNGLAGCPGDFI